MGAQPLVLGAVLIVILSVVSYRACLRNGFVWDDHALIVENESIKSWGSLAENLTSDFFFFGRSPLSAQKRGYYRPLATLSYMLDYSLWTLDPRGYHFTNLLAHIMASIAMLLVFDRIFTGKPWTGVVAAALYCLHPIHTESVYWISGRTDVLSGLFFFAAFYCYLRAHPLATGEASNPSSVWAVAGVAGFALALLSKEAAVVLPLILASWEYSMRPARRREDRDRLGERLGPYVLAGVAYVVIRLVVLRIPVPLNEWLASHGRGAVLLTFLKATGFYALKLLIPWPLSAYYQMPVSHHLLQLGVLIPLVAVAGLYVLFWRRRGRGVVPFLCTFFMLTLLPVSNLIPIGAPRDMGFLVAERFLYIPSAAFCGVVALGLTAQGSAGSPKRRSGVPVRVLCAIPIVAIYMVLTVQRGEVWHDNLTFYRELVRQAPGSSLAHYLLGLEYWNGGDAPRGEAEMREALRCDPTSSWARNNLGNMLYVQGHLVGAIQEWALATRLDPSNCQAWLNLARALDSVGRTADAAHAYRAFLRTAPASLGDHRKEVEVRLRNLGEVTP